MLGVLVDMERLVRGVRTSPVDEVDAAPEDLRLDEMADRTLAITGT
jgi:hypothetical protein